MNENKKLVISFELMNTIVVTLLDLPAKTSRLLLNRIEKEVTPYPEIPKAVPPDAVDQSAYATKEDIETLHNNATS